MPPDDDPNQMGTGQGDGVKEGGPHVAHLAEGWDDCRMWNPSPDFGRVFQKTGWFFFVFFLAILADAFNWPKSQVVDS